MSIILLTPSFLNVLHLLLDMYFLKIWASECLKMSRCAYFQFGYWEFLLILRCSVLQKIRDIIVLRLRWERSMFLRYFKYLYWKGNAMRISEEWGLWNFIVGDLIGHKINIEIRHLVLGFDEFKLIFVQILLNWKAFQILLWN